MFPLTLKLKLLEKSKCKSTAFCNLYVTDSALFSSDLFSWHFSGKKKKKTANGKQKIFRRVRLPFQPQLVLRLSTPKCSYKFDLC